MELYDKVFLTILYVLVSIISIIFLYENIRKNKKIRIIDYFNIYYILVYFIVPIFYFYNTYSKFDAKYSIYLRYDYKYHILSLIFTILFYLIINSFYKIFNFKFKSQNEVVLTSKKFLILNLIFSVVGAFSYYMWSKIYGFPFGILKYADLLRDNKIVNNNPYTIFQPFCSFALFASYSWLILVKQYKEKINKIMSLLLFFITFMFSILSVFATDSRNSIITLFLVPIIYLISYKKINFKKIIVLGLISILVLGKLDNFTYYIRNNDFKQTKETSNIRELLSYEFGFTYANRINLLYNLDHTDVKYTEMTDIKNIILSWVPKSKKPEHLQDLGKYNTSLYTYASGTIPTDIVTASIYKGRLVGFIFLAFFMGLFLKFFDNYFSSKQDNFYKIIFYYFCIVLNMRFVAYYDLSNILFDRFALIIYFFMISFFCKERNLENNK